MPALEESQLKLHLKTTLSKLQYKLGKSRTLSSQTLQTKIVPGLKDLATLATPPSEEDATPVQTRQFERALELIRVQIAEMVRRDRHADVWEDLLGELGLLDGSVGRICGMADEVIQRENIRADAAKKERNAASKASGGSIWTFWKQTPAIQELAAADIEENGDKVDIYDPLTPNGQDRYTKIIRNALVAEWFIGDEVKELRKLKAPLSRCVDKDLAHACGTKEGIKEVELAVKYWYRSQLPEGQDEVTPKMMDLEDRTLVEIIRKLRGDEEESVVDDYLCEIADIYRIDIYAEGKFDEDMEEDDEGDVSSEDKESTKDKESSKDNDEKGTGSKKGSKPKPLDSKKKLSDLDELKKRFDDLKRL